MSVKIRLKKLGRKHRPFFRLCAMDTRTRRDGREIEELGIYDPMVEETDARAILNGERIDYWLSVGAKPSPKAGTLIKKYGTDGTHLEAQKEALEKIGGRRASSIAAAVKEAETTKVEIKEEETKPEGAEGESSEDASAETQAESGETATAEEAPSEAAEATAEEGAEASAESSDSSEEKKEDSDG